MAQKYGQKQSTTFIIKLYTERGKMVKNIDLDEKKKLPDKQDHDKKHLEEYRKHYEKDHSPRKIKPVESENKKHKGPKI